jgi:hypothetical protein
LKKYRVTIESNFVNFPDDPRQLYGYFTTLEVIGEDPKHAFQGLVPQLIRYINSKNICLRRAGFFQTNYLLDNAWEVNEDADPAPDFVGGTFVFYQITKWKAWFSLLRFWLVRLTKPHLVFLLPET